MLGGVKYATAKMADLFEMKFYESEKGNKTSLKEY